MKKIEKSVTELLNERNAMIANREQINISMNAIADKAQAEKREFTAEENVEYQKSIRTAIPLKISEAEPKDVGGKK